MTDTAPTRRKRILLSSVFGPYGVDDAYGRKENIMELMHNQVTRGQGLASFRFQHRSFGLYFLAANVDADVTILDFPSKQRFTQELAGDYDMVGISFIAPNMIKAQEMARLTRQHAPEAAILLGGHGATMDNIATLVDCDHVCRGEGIAWLRRLLGQDPDAPITHPTLPSSERQRIFGVPVPGPSASLLVPGVGCVNGCSFCCTSHFFDKRYTPFLSTGQELFDTACRIADERDSDDFFVMDENFLKSGERASELMRLMEHHRRPFRFEIFSSAEAITAFGVDNLARLGVNFVWLGAESSMPGAGFVKNQGIDLQALVAQLRERGILVLASGILCMEQHTPDNVQQDIDYMCNLAADFVQFMLLTPLPTTGLYRDMERRGLLRDDLAWEDWHGQKELGYKHPAFGPGEPARIIDRAFAEEYERNGSSMLRVIETSMRGVLHLRARPERDWLWQKRLSQLEEQTRRWSLMMHVIKRFAVNHGEYERALALEQAITTELGALSPLQKATQIGALAAAHAWRVRVALRGDHLAHRTIVTRPPSLRQEQRAHVLTRALFPTPATS